jgi:hypothetical protein
MKKLLLTLLFFSNLVLGQGADYLSPGGMTQIMDGRDDATQHISLGHAFPYYGGVFTDAWMSTNGFILLYDPVKQFGNQWTDDSRCCSGFDPTGYDGYFSFMLAPLWTDLVDLNNTLDDGYWYKTNEGASSFLWYNVNEFGSTNTNTFQIDLWPDGSFDFIYDEVDIIGHDTWIGFTGDATIDVTQLQFSQSSVDEFSLDFISQTFSGGRAWYGQDGGYESSLDCTDALNDSRCPKYQEAYFAYECDMDPLYDTNCPGYDQEILIQEMSDTDFIFGDDISDFYYEEETEMFLFEEDETYMFTEEDIYGDDYDGFTYSDESEDPFGDGGYEEETFEEAWDLSGEELDEFYSDDPLPEGEELYAESDPLGEEGDIYTESFDESLEEGMGAFEYSEDLIVEEDIFVEDILIIEEEKAAGPNVNPVSIAMAQVEDAIAQTEENMSKMSSEFTSEDDDMSNNDGNLLTTFGDETAFYEDATLNLIVDPTITVMVDSEEQSETVEVMSDNTVASSEQGFQEQQNQSFSTGQSITAVLNNVTPNFSQFDVAPPSQQEQQTSDRAASQANNMSEEQLASNLDEFTDQMQDSGGFTDQSLTMFLMGRVNGFDAYNTTLQDVSFYTDRGIPGGRVQNDRNTMLQLIGSSGKHEEMIAEQYK